MANSTPRKRGRKAAASRPDKPYPEFPLTPHPSGAWQKKIRGKIRYFGRWGKIVNGKMERLPGDGWEAALALYKAQADDLHAGREPRVHKTGDGLTLGELRGRFLTAKSRELDAGDITRPTYTEYRAIADLLVAQFGEQRLVDDLAADDFEVLRAEMAKRWGPVRLGNAVQRVRTVFKYGYEAGLIDKPVRYGPSFRKPSAAVLRRHRAQNGERMIEAAELRRLLDALEGKEVQTGRIDEEMGKPETVTLTANPMLRAMLLLGVNCGFNSKDIADLPLAAVDLDKGWINFPRKKTGIARRCPLWPETIAALRAALTVRPEPQHDDAKGLVFVTSRGNAWLTRGQAGPVSRLASELLQRVGLHREGIGFATLRHVFRTVADGCRDQVAIGHIMGHSDGTMAAVYRERIEDSRLQTAVEYVRQWLYSPAPGKKEGGAA